MTYALVQSNSALTAGSEQHWATKASHLQKVLGELSADALLTCVASGAALKPYTML